MSGNLRAALEQYDAQQRRQAALLEAQRIGNLIHIQEQQLVAAKHLAKQRANAYRQRQQLQQQILQQQLLQQQQQQQQQEQEASRPVQQTLAPLPEIAECAIDDEEESPLPSPRALLPSASLAASSRLMDDQTTPTLAVDIRAPLTPTGVSVPAYLSHQRRPRECDATLCSRSDWKPDHLSASCDNIRCPVRFSLLGQRRHHCRLCGNIFCAACLPHKEVLHDMSKLPWNYMPEMFIASLFPPHDLKQEPTSAPSTPTLSSSYESGSSRASASDSYSASEYSSTSSASASASTSSASTVPRIYSGTDKHIEWPIPDYLREIAISTATEHKICTDCHARIHDLPIPSDVYEERVALQEIREEIAWSMWLLGLDRWDQTLRNHGLTLKPTRTRTERRPKLTRRESVTSSSTEATDVSHFTSHSAAASEMSDESTTQASCGASQSDSQSDASSQSQSQSQQGRSTPVSVPLAPTTTTDACERPLDFDRYAWPTAPAFVRFTAKALAPPPAPAPQPEPIPSAFGARKSPARYLYPIRPPVAPVEPPKPTEEEVEADRQARYEAALTEYKREAYDLAYARPCFRRAFSMPTTRSEENWYQTYGESLAKWWRSL